MKILTLVCVAVLLAACETSFYQVSTLKPVSTPTSSNISVKYDFWYEGGAFSCSVYNNTDSVMTVYLEKTFLVVNQSSQEYFRNISETHGRTFSATSPQNKYRNQSISTTSSELITVIDKPKIHVPPKSYRTLSAPPITSDYFSDCALKRGPGSKPSVVDYAETNTPFFISNVITYSVGGSEMNYIEKFYVSGIANVPKRLFVHRGVIEECNKQRYYANISPYMDKAKFYLKYHFEGSSSMSE